MKKLLIAFLIIFSVCKISDVHCQNTTRIQPIANPLNLNPAFTGFSQNPRIGSQYLNSKNGDFVTVNLNYDQHVNFLRGGAGISTNYISSYDGGFTTFSIAGLYAYEFKLGENAGIRAGINANFNQGKADREIFGFREDNFSPPLIPGKITKNFFNMEAGLIAYNSNLYGGFSVQNIPEPIVIYSERLKTIAPIIFNTQIGGFIHLSENLNNGWLINPYVMTSSISPPVNNSIDNLDWRHTFNPGLNVSRSIFTIGTKYSLNESFRILSCDISAGVNIGKVKVGYGTRLLNRFSFQSPQHEVSFIFHFNKPKDISNNKMVNNLRRTF